MSDPAPEPTAMPGTATSGPGVVVPSEGRAALRERLRALGTAALPLGLLAFLGLSGLPSCPSRYVLGIPCPGCGLTRATLALLHLDWEAVWRFHPLAPIVTPVVGWVLLKPVLEELRILPPGRVWIRVPQALWAALAIAFALLYVLRVAGLLGGLADPIDPGSGLLGRTLLSLVALAGR